MPSVPVAVRANKKLGTTHGSQWHLLARDGGGAGPLAAFLWTLSRDSSKSQEPSPEEGIWSQAGHCQPGSRAFSELASLFAAPSLFPHLNPDGEGRCWKDLTRQLPVPHAPLHEGASARRLL